jgi:hypothetical protein
MTARNIWTLVISIGVALYLVLALSPLKTTIGRSYPGVASVFSPPLFNFSASYESGSVLDFFVGMSREQTFSVLKGTYVGRSKLLSNCVGTRANSLIPVTASLDIASAYGGGDRLCAYLESGRLLLDFTFQNGAVSRIDLAYVRTEGT